MSLPRKVFLNIIILFGARVAYRLFSALAIILATNYLGADLYGRFATALAWSNIFLAVNDLGMSTLMVREASRDHTKMPTIFGNTLIVEVVFSLLFFGMTVALASGFHYDHTTLLLIMILTAAGLLYEFRKVMRGIFRVLFQLKDVVILEILNGIVTLATTWVIITLVTNRSAAVVQLAEVRLVINVAFIVGMFLYTLSIVQPRVQFRSIIPMIKAAIPFSIYNFFFMLYFQIDQIIISLLRTSRDVGFYSAAAQIVGVLLFIPLMVFQVTMPIMYRYSQNNLAKYQRIHHALTRYLAAIGIPAGCGLAVFAPQIIHLIYPHGGFAASIPILQIMGIFLAIRFIGIGHGNSLMTMDKQGSRARIQFMAVLFNIVGDVILIARYGALGAAIATTVTEIFITTTTLAQSARLSNETIRANLLPLLPILAASGTTLGILYLTKPFISIIVLMVFGLMLYPMCLWLFRFVSPYDRGIIKEILTKKEIE